MWDYHFIEVDFSSNLRSICVVRLENVEKYVIL